MGCHKVLLLGHFVCHWCPVTGPWYVWWQCAASCSGLGVCPCLTRWSRSAIIVSMALFADIYVINTLKAHLVSLICLYQPACAMCQTVWVWPLIFFLSMTLVSGMLHHHHFALTTFDAFISCLKTPLLWILQIADGFLFSFFMPSSSFCLCSCFCLGTFLCACVLCVSYVYVGYSALCCE